VDHGRIACGRSLQGYHEHYSGSHKPFDVCCYWRDYQEERNSVAEFDVAGSRDRDHHDVQVHDSVPYPDAIHLGRHALNRTQAVAYWFGAIRQFAGLASLVNSEPSSNWLEQVWELPTG
jgi:hypothetical protein